MSTTSHYPSATSTLLRRAQTEICRRLEQCDGKATFEADCWTRVDDQGAHGGGGETRIARNGAVFEQAGVNFSEVHGTLPGEMSEKLLGRRESLPFFATGISLVIHPYSPMVPTTHANLRFLTVADKAWFGGGSDLTPYYLFEEDAQHFHRTIKRACDTVDTSFYPRFKKWCDEYFYLPHRREARGVGGIFFDYGGRDNPAELPLYSQLVETLAGSLMDFYIPIVERRKAEPFTTEQKEFQLLRRGRYVEFNLLYDRGTLFGLKTNGRTESILMSLPPEVRWEYNFEAQPGSAEERLIAALKTARDWA